MLGEAFIKFRTASAKVTSVMNAVATFWIFAVMFIMTGDVLGRVLFNKPITGTPEIVKVSIVGIVFLQIPHTLWVNRHIRSEILLVRLKSFTRSVFLIFTDLLGVAVFVGIMWASWGDAIIAWQKLEIEGEGALRVPVYPIRTIIILGSLMTAIHFAIKVIQTVTDMRKKSPGRE